MRVEIATFVIALLLSRSIESRKGRWARIGISFVVVFPGTQAFGFFESVHRPDFIEQSIAYLTAVAVVLGASGVLAATWAGPVAKIGTMLLESLIDSADNRSLPQTRLHEACALLKVKDYRQARRLAKLCVHENPDDIDTRLVAARILLTSGCRRSAQWHCWRVLFGHRSSPSQQSCARYLLDQIRSIPKQPSNRSPWHPPQKLKLN
jgi:hypothetical protein